MPEKKQPGLGELLRYVNELVEHGAEHHYQQMGLDYRARFTPVLRAIQAGASTVTQITAHSHLTQGAISQTVGQMESEGLIARQRLADARMSRIELTAHGQQLIARLEQHWSTTFQVIEDLEQEIGYPLCQALQHAARALEQKGFAQRLTELKLNHCAGKTLNEQ
ncbi:MarR family transcriptional regulator [Pseudomonas sp. 21LCFQ010]|uniref:MarR family winged helix-turn-helix transcriptional regulator n=1 Tax=Pseudomonas sp. 21LCFQ010 TaxID=2957506 RepID=UPI0020984EB3|nr:MarR family transcriptional regulator [Pseudomonas sp. 21LCFQ010]MCO8161251.1 MarR family transcriptional regulator [Pseudomonas sp. 21LCFQ010]